MDKKNQTKSDTEYWRLAGKTAIVASIILLILLIGMIFKVILFALTGILLAAFFRGIAHWISDLTGLSMNSSIILSLFMAVCCIALFYIFFVPIMQAQAHHITKKMPTAVDNLRQFLGRYWWGRDLLEHFPVNPQKFVYQKAIWAKNTFGLVSSTFGVLIDVLIIIFIGIFMMLNPTPYVNGIVSLVPASGQPRAWKIIREVFTILQRWLAGKLMSMLVVAILTFIGLLLLGIPMPLTLALIAGTLAFVPNFGPIASLVPAVIVGFIQGPDTALYIIFLYMIVQLLESYLITPFIQREMVYLPLAMVIIAQLVLGVLVGGLGLVLATPIVAVTLVLVRMIYIEDILGQEVVKNN